MDASAVIEPEARANATILRKLPMLAPLAAALAYPFLLHAFHAGMSQPGGDSSAAWTVLAAACLLGALATPILALARAARLSRAPQPSAFELRARRVAYLAMAAPPLFVATGVVRGLTGRPLSDEIIWISGWLAVGAYALAARGERAAPAGPVAAWRVAHGVSAALILCFAVFHLGNHLLGWAGPDVHRAVMEMGRAVYRSPVVEPVLVALLLFQVASGVRLAWRWSASPADRYRVFQIGSGAYLAAFIVTHLTSALVSARAVRGIETDWAWASGAPDGLLYDAWNIRLLPHYAFGVFFVLAHLASGLRQVLRAHGVSEGLTDRIWLAGLLASGLASAAIITALCGARI